MAAQVIELAVVLVGLGVLADAVVVALDDVRFERSRLDRRRRRG